MPSRIHYIIDGSNLLHYSGLTEDYGGDVVAAREELTRLLGGIIGEKDSSSLGTVSRVTVVYDIHTPFGVLKERISGVDVIYAVGKKHEQPADREILLLLEKIRKHPSLDEEIRLVTDDNSLRREVIYFGCSPVRCGDFWLKFGMDYR